MTEQEAAGAPMETVELHNNRDEIAALEEAVVERIERLGYPQSTRFAIILALEEAITNAFQHGHQDLPETTPISVHYAVSADRIRIHVEDRGPGFEPEAVPDPTIDENITSPSGRGMMLIRAYMSDVRHNATGNALEMVYERPADGE